jgi:hypothetical protein
MLLHVCNLILIKVIVVVVVVQKAYLISKNDTRLSKQGYYQTYVNHNDENAYRCFTY